MLIIISNLPLVSIIILNYNCKTFLFRCLSSVFKSDYPNFEVILVDNNSKDDSISYVRKRFESEKRLKIVELSENHGFSIGNNMGSKYAKGKYLVFLNPDTETNPNWLHELVSAMNLDPNIGVAQPKILLMDSNRFDTAGCFINRFGLSWSSGAGEEDNGQYDKVKKISYAKGAAFIISADLWEKLGGFDGLFFTYFEETDLCWRVWKVGYKVLYIPTAIVHHVGQGSLKKISYRLKFHEAKGRIALLIKHYTVLDIFRYVPFLLGLSLFNVAYHIAKRNPFGAIAIIRGSFWCLFNLRAIWISRLKLEENLCHICGGHYIVPLVNFTIPKNRNFLN